KVRRRWSIKVRLNMERLHYRAVNGGDGGNGITQRSRETERSTSPFLCVIPLPPSPPLGADISEFEDDAHTGTSEVELCIAQAQPKQIQILERVEIANVSSYPGVLAEEEVDAAADVPAKAVVVGREHARRRQRDVRLDEPEAD